MLLGLSESPLWNGKKNAKATFKKQQKWNLLNSFVSKIKITFVFRVQDHHEDGDAESDSTFDGFDDSDSEERRVKAGERCQPANPITGIHSNTFGHRRTGSLARLMNTKINIELQSNLC